MATPAEGMAAFLAQASSSTPNHHYRQKPQDFKFPKQVSIPAFPSFSQARPFLQLLLFSLLCASVWREEGGSALAHSSWTEGWT